MVFLIEIMIYKLCSANIIFTKKIEKDIITIKILFETK